jgi:hypothetical protein
VKLLVNVSLGRFPLSSRSWRPAALASSAICLLRAALVVVIDAGDRPGDSAVHATDEVILRPPVPAEAVAPLTARAGGRPICGFVRLPEGLLPLGELHRTSHGSWYPSGLSQAVCDAAWATS